MKEKVNFPIDIVVTWVDQNDKKWKKKYDQYSIKSGDDRSGTRFRDYGTLKYLFRSIEKYAPWVNRIFFITDHQKPIWLDTTNEKLVLIDHEDYIDKKYLPTFNSNVLDLNMSKIKQLSEHFILFNDDTFINKPTNPTDFFTSQGQPRDSLALNAIMPVEIFDHIYINNISIVNHKYSKRDNMRNNFFKFFNLKNYEWNLFTLLLTPWPKFTRFYDPHIPISLKKSVLLKLVNDYPEVLNNTNQEKFRSTHDFSIWLVRYIQMLDGDFKPRSAHFGKHYDLVGIKKVVQDIDSSKHTLLNINDSDKLDMKKFEDATLLLNQVFERKFTKKSTFEI
ncbi:Stealth CR1 domain-containing protein [Latilactobacillus curvatus]|uniref:Stealth CR1 domain-containing protein n=1 Tax=Latilactobacillus curvatus TaxID=28038 RepID=UPI002242D600|nr:Stealth CR1 domain-containing protein [Latilactobacillus curvatus]MCW8779810.1 Stealth CR1 domain-containing protein [Latilactobacillus curvatus]